MLNFSSRNSRFSTSGIRRNRRGWRRWGFPAVWVCWAGSRRWSGQHSGVGREGRHPEDSRAVRLWQSSNDAKCMQCSGHGPRHVCCSLLRAVALTNQFSSSWPPLITSPGPSALFRWVTFWCFGAILFFRDGENSYCAKRTFRHSRAAMKRLWYSDLKSQCRYIFYILKLKKWFLRTCVPKAPQQLIVASYLTSYLPVSLVLCFTFPSDVAL